MVRLKATNAIQLQSVGWVSAIPAGELVPGDVTIWNFGHKSKVLEITPKPGRKTLMAKLEVAGALPWERKFLATRLVGVDRETYLRHRPDDTDNKVRYDLGALARKIFPKETPC